MARPRSSRVDLERWIEAKLIPRVQQGRVVAVKNPHSFATREQKKPARHLKSGDMKSLASASRLDGESGEAVSVQSVRQIARRRRVWRGRDSQIRPPAAATTRVSGVSSGGAAEVAYAENRWRARRRHLTVLQQVAFEYPRHVELANCRLKACARVRYRF